MQNEFPKRFIRRGARRRILRRPSPTDRLADTLRLLDYQVANRQPRQTRYETLLDGPETN